MPKRKAESQEKTCNICLDRIKNEATLDSCTHTFCRKCIVKWAKSSNTCPCCRKEFTEVKTAKSKKKIKRARPRQEDGRDMVRDFIMETLSRFIASDEFKVMVAERFLLHPDPTIHFICRQMRHILNNNTMRDHIASLDNEQASEELERARDAINAMYRTVPGSEENPISITI